MLPFAESVAAAVLEHHPTAMLSVWIKVRATKPLAIGQTKELTIPEERVGRKDNGQRVLAPEGWMGGGTNWRRAKHKRQERQ